MKLIRQLIGCCLIGNSVAFAEAPPALPTPLPSSNDPLHLNWMNKQVSPAQDFYSYANGAWQKNNPIPAEYASWGTFNIVHEKMQNIIHEMLIKAAADKNAKPGSIEQKIGDFYYSGMDEELIDQIGLAPLLGEFNKIDEVQNSADLQKEIAHLHQIGVGALFNFGSMQDYQDSKLMIGAALQGGLGLPDRDYYLKPDPKFKKIRDAYVEHIGKMFELMGEEPGAAARAANTIMAIEMQLAKASMSQIEQRDPHAVYHLKTIAELDKNFSNFSWSNYLQMIGQGQLKSINLAMPTFFVEMNKMITAVPLDAWKTYLRWHLIDDYSSYLSKPFVEENFKLNKAISGTEKLLPRWKRVVGTENAALGFAIGKMYVDTYFSAQSRTEVLDILKNIRAVLQEDMANIKWMSPATRTAALKKLQLMEERIGYPKKWWDYSTLQIDRGPYALNVMRANEFLVKRDLAKIGKPVDKTEWAMTPQTINAYYDSSMNNLNMPAGILQSPFFDPNAPVAVNYGAIGFVMGHEMTHGFDDQGAQFDGEGNLKNWWGPSDLAQFQKATQCIVDQYSSYVVDGDLHVQGKLVSGEAAADLGGVTLAYKAFHRSQAFKNAKTVDGFTPDQQFFLGVAHVWATNIRPQQLRNQVTTDPHPPAQYRVNGTLANMPQFQAAFNIPANSPMINKNRCVVW